MSDPDFYTIGWICALVTEYVAAQVFLDEKHEPPESVAAHDNNEYTLGRMGNHNIVIAVLPDGQYGLSMATAVARNMLHSFKNIRVGLMVGIGGGAPTSDSDRDIRLGDIVVSSPSNGRGGVFQYDFGKTIQGREFQTTGFLNQPPEVLRAAVNGLKAEFEQEGNKFERAINSILEKKPRLRQKYGRPPPETDRLFRSDVVYDPNCRIEDITPEMLVSPRRERTEFDDNPAVFYGLIASANQLMKDASIRDKLAEKEGVLCFEMEAAGLMNQFPCLVIRGICDYSDSHKNKNWQGYAAMAAAAYAKALICRIQQTRLESQKKIVEVIVIMESVREDVSEIKDHINHDILNKLRIAEGAQYDTYQNQNEPTCYPDTRVDILRDVQFWARDSSDQRIYWLNGMAGTGKSIIARTVADTLDSMGLLGATFFFKRGEKDCGGASLVFSTIARQLARHRPELRSHLVEAIEQTDNISSKSIKEQFTKLIFNPLKAAKSEPGNAQTLILVLEALDECAVEKDVETLISLLSKVVQSNIFGLKLFVTSRPEITIRDAFNSVSVESYLEVRLQDIPNEVLARDIALYLEHKLKQIKDWWNKRYITDPSEQLCADWPGTERLNTLVHIAIPLFLFAAIACRFIQDDLFGSPEEQLLNLIQAAKETGVNDKLGETYLPVLQRFQTNRSGQERDDLMKRFKKIIGTLILLEEPLSSNSIANLLKTKATKIDGILNPLRSVLDIPEERNSEVKLFHLSFRDFLLSPLAGSFSINLKQTHWQNALDCLDLLCKKGCLRYNLGNLKPADHRSAIEKSALQKQLPPHVRYACLYWFYHLEKAGQSLKDDDKISEFLQTHFLHWLEALSILGEAARATQMPEQLLPLVEYNK
ncbi:G-protein beta WD-40 repeats containing [Colletotrichum tofieldiae]|nr:G-protein beta WD-40 repeats containing [Colletotrichum tofieldiae]